MPVITSQARPAVGASTEDSWKAPHRTLLANTKAASIQTPFSAPVDDQPKASESTEAAAPEENRQDSISKEETRSKEAVTLSPQLTALARREQKFRQQEQAFKAQQAEFEAEKAKVAKLLPLQERLAAKDYSALDELGIDYNAYTEHLLNRPEDVNPEAKAVNELREELNQLKTDQQKKEEKQYEATVNQYRNDINDLVAKDSQYESIKELKAEEHVLQHILDTFSEDGIALTIEQAAKEVEDELLAEAERMSNLTKIKAKRTPAEPEKKVLPPPAKSGIKTLTQQIAPSTQNKYPQFQHLSPKERLAQALAKAQRPQS